MATLSAHCRCTDTLVSKARLSIYGVTVDVCHVARWIILDQLNANGHNWESL